MKRFIAALLALMLFLAVGAAMAKTGEELILNGDFSRLDALGLPEDWNTGRWFTDEGISLLYTEADGAGGNCVVVLNADANDARFCQTIPVEPGKTYRFRCRARAEGCGNGGIGATLSFENTFVYSDELYDTNGSWQELTVYGTAGKKQRSVTLMLRVGGYGMISAGKAWFDDVSCVEVDPSTIPDDVTIYMLTPEENNGGSEEAKPTVEAGEPARHTELFLILAFFYALVVLSVVRKRGRIPDMNARSAGIAFGVVLAVALIVRVYVSAVVPGYYTDVNCFTAWGGRMVQNGPVGFYAEDYFCDYPPLYMPVLALPEGLRRLFGAAVFSGMHRVLLKLVPVLCDLLGACLVRRCARRNGLSERAALLLAAFYAFNPAAIIDSAAWGQIDAVLTLLIVFCALMAVEQRYIPALIAFAAAALVKPQALLFAPVGLFMILVQLTRRTATPRKLLEALAGLGCALGLIYLTGLLFTIGRGATFGETLVLPVRFIAKIYGDSLGSYDYLSINALNLYTLFNLNWAPTASQPVATVFAWVMFALSYAYALFLCIRSRRKGDLFLIGAVLLLLICAFAPKIHERYAFTALLLLTLAYGYRRDRRILIVLTTVTITLGLNELLVLQGGMGTGNYGHLNDKERVVNAVLSLIVVFNALYALWIGADIVAQGHIVPLSAAEAVPAPAAQVQAAGRRLRLRRAEYLLMAAGTLVYGVLAFANLGDMRAPQTSWVSSKSGETVTFDLGAEERFRMMYYGGICTSNFTVELSNDGARWTEPCYAEYSEGQIFRWLCFTPRDEGGNVIYADAVDPGDGSAYLSYAARSGATPYQAARYVRITARSAGLVLSEAGFWREDGSLIEVRDVARTGELAETATDPRALVDEQDTVPERPSYMNSTYFDEIYHARTAYELAHGMSIYEWTHPPLGKILIMLGIKLFGMTPFGWRCAGAFFGVMMVPLMYLLARQLTKAPKYAFTAMLLMMADSMHFTQTRIATVDSFVVFWIMLEFFFMLRYLQTAWASEFRQGLVPLALCGITMGLACATKWSGIYSGLGLALLFAMKLVREGREAGADRRYWRRALGTCGFCVIFFVLLPALIYFLSYTPQLRYEGVMGVGDMFTKRRFDRVVGLQESMYSYHAGLGGDTHPFRSPWYEWPVIARPIWFYSGSEYLLRDMVTSISCMGNPAVWWTGLAALLILLFGCAWKRRTPRAWLWVLIGYAAVYLPWVLVPRSMFIYHYFPCVPYLILCISLALQALERRNAAAARALNTAIPIAAFVLFAAFYPLESGVPAHREYVKYLRWFKWTNY